MRRRRRGGRVGWGGGAGVLPRKNHFRPHNDKFGCIFTQVLTGRKHGPLRKKTASPAYQ